MTLAHPSLSIRRAQASPSLRVLTAILSQMDRARLELTAPDGAVHVFGPGGAPVAHGKTSPAILELRSQRAASAILARGDVGFAEGYMDGGWSTPDLVQLLTVIAANQPALERAYYGRWWARLLLRLRHHRRANTRTQARRNIVAHYDLGNAFYALWLDRTMTYSAALFDGHADRPLADAQQAKYDRALAELDLAQGGRILEIGCGWGGFAETAARAGHRVTGISLSDAQTAYARDRLARAGLADRAELRILDYRDARGPFDGVASIEMIEAVGERFWPHYFRTIRDALVPGGRACIQAITIADDRFERYRTQSDFIQQYIFPGGMLPSRGRLLSEARAAGLTLVNEHAFGRDYAETLRQWLGAFDDALPAIRAQGFDDAFVRCWRFYLAYCAAGFDTATTDVAQYTLARR